MSEKKTETASFRLSYTEGIDKGVNKLIRKDVFINKAAEWLANHVTYDGYTFQSKAKMIREFKKAMEL